MADERIESVTPCHRARRPDDTRCLMEYKNWIGLLAAPVRRQSWVSPSHRLADYTIEKGT